MDLYLSTLAPVAITTALTLGGLGGGLLLSRLLFRAPPAGDGGRQRRDGVVAAAVRGPLVVWSTMLGLYLAAEVTTLPGTTGYVVRRVLMVLLIVSVTWSLARAAAVAVARALARLPTVNLIANLARVSVLMLGGLVLLQT
ncbi:MAG: hypothetical protein ACREN5_00425, partial [Gemmatimonadales bacterium]